MKYRYALVMENLSIAFPEKTAEEREKIARGFYRNFSDQFVETIKFISISKRSMHKRFLYDNTLVNNLAAKGKSINCLAGHIFNWEIIPVYLPLMISIPFVALYSQLNNKIFDRIFYKLRTKYGARMVSTNQFRANRSLGAADQFALGLGADQNPGYPAKAFWINFFGKPVPFATGPGRLSQREDIAVVLFIPHKIKRGHYDFKTCLITDNGLSMSPEQITVAYRNLLEENIRIQPDNYLWSHRRWRHEWKEEYGTVIA